MTYQNAPQEPMSPRHEVDDRINIENRLTKLETTVKNFRWFASILVPLAAAAISAIVTFLLRGSP